MAGPNAVTSTNYADRRYTAIIPVQLASLANSSTLKLAVPHAFRVESVLFRIGKPASTASKAATATFHVSGSAASGGVISLTTANCTPMGGTVASTTLTSGNTGSAGGTIEFAISSVTAFAEGDGWFEATVVDTSQGAMAF